MSNSRVGGQGGKVSGSGRRLAGCACSFSPSSSPPARSPLRSHRAIAHRAQRPPARVPAPPGCRRATKRDASGRVSARTRGPWQTRFLEPMPHRETPRIVRRRSTRGASPRTDRPRQTSSMLRPPWTCRTPRMRATSRLRAIRDRRAALTAWRTISPTRGIAGPASTDAPRAARTPCRRAPVGDADSGAPPGSSRAGPRPA